MRSTGMTQRSNPRIGFVRLTGRELVDRVWSRPSGRKLAPLGQGSGAVLLEDVAAVEVAILVEVVVN